LEAVNVWRFDFLIEVRMNKLVWALVEYF